MCSREKSIDFRRPSGPCVRVAFQLRGLVSAYWVMTSFPPIALITVETKRYTVKEYAEYYDVEPITVRQWIRQCKIRMAVTEQEGMENLGTY